MKFNMKRLREICESEQAGACVYDALDGFEKKLQALIKEIEVENDRILKDINEDQLLPDSYAHAIMRSSYHNNGQILILKEILGE